MIKFRAWDKDENRYFIDGKDGYLANLLCCNDWDMFDPDDYVWEQFTGLKDANGKDIYESDILRVTTGEDGESYIATVKWFGDEDYPAFDLEGIPAAWNYDANALATIFNSGVETCEVIGNVFEGKTTN